MNTAEYQAFVESRWGRKVGGSVEDLADLYVMTAGLGGETGEVLEKLKKHIRDGKIDRLELAKELGDTLYYLTKIAGRYGITLDEIMEINVTKLTDRAARGQMRGSGDNR